VFTPSPVTLVGALVLGVVDFRAVWATTETTVIARIIATAMMCLVILGSFASPSQLHNLKHRGHVGIQGLSHPRRFPFFYIARCLLLYRDHINFHQHVLGQARYFHGRASRRGGAEILAVNLVHSGEI